jgi:hypothetical protein
MVFAPECQHSHLKVFASGC